MQSLSSRIRAALEVVARKTGNKVSSIIKISGDFQTFKNLCRISIEVLKDNMWYYNKIMKGNTSEPLGTPIPSQSIVERVHRVFKQNGLKLSVAESCTGGLISHYITSLPGASLFFEAGAVTYSIDAKKRILGIEEEMLTRYGVISKETAALMALSIIRITGSHYGLSTTGNLGPDVLEGKERGLIYIGVAHKDKTRTRELRLTGDRGQNKEEASLKALEFLLEVMEEIADG